MLHLPVEEFSFSKDRLHRIDLGTGKEERHRLVLFRQHRLHSLERKFIILVIHDALELLKNYKHLYTLFLSHLERQPEHGFDIIHLDLPVHGNDLIERREPVTVKHEMSIGKEPFNHGSILIGRRIQRTDH